MVTRDFPFFRQLRTIRAGCLDRAEGSALDASEAYPETEPRRSTRPAVAAAPPLERNGLGASIGRQNLEDPPGARASDAIAGFTIVEIAIVVALIGLIAGFAGTSYSRYVERSRVVQAVAEISLIATAIDASRAWDDSPPPDSLSELDLTTPNDPWGNPYHYLRIEGVFDVTANPPGGIELPHVSTGTRPPPDKPRKDRFFKPISTDYDLYSSGPDCDSRDSLEHRDSRDDVVRALDGEFVGPAEIF